MKVVTHDTPVLHAVPITDFHDVSTTRTALCSAKMPHGHRGRAVFTDVARTYN